MHLPYDVGWFSWMSLLFFVSYVPPLMALDLVMFCESCERDDLRWWMWMRQFDVFCELDLLALDLILGRGSHLDSDLDASPVSNYRVTEQDPLV